MQPHKKHAKKRKTKHEHKITIKQQRKTIKNGVKGQFVTG
jgi:hypothetical protein